jgi:hypothetical protein
MPQAWHDWRENFMASMLSSLGALHPSAEHQTIRMNLLYPSFRSQQCTHTKPM